jgi:hypothetical protein
MIYDSSGAIIVQILYNYNVGDRQVVCNCNCNIVLWTSNKKRASFK